MVTKLRRDDFLAAHDDQVLAVARLDAATVRADLAAAGMSADALKAADLDGDGRIVGPEELKKLFLIVDELDRDGSYQSIIVADESGPTPPGRVMSILEVQFEALAVTPPAPLQGLFFNDFFPGKAALSFDDGPHPVNTPKILDALAAAGVKATFFVLGQKVERYPELVRRIAREGHTLANHTFTHPKLTNLDAESVAAELLRCQAAVDAALVEDFPDGYPLVLARPPFGAKNSVVEAALAEKGSKLIEWTVDSNDWRYTNDDQAILDNVFSGPYRVQRRGGVLLFHDIHPQTARVLPQVLAKVTENDIAWTTVGELLTQKYA